MVFLTIQTTNSSFISRDEGHDYTSLDQAKAAAVESSLQIAGEEVRGGKTSCSVEAILTDRDGHQRHRLSVAVSVATLFSPEAGAA